MGNPEIGKEIVSGLKRAVGIEDLEAECLDRGFDCYQLTELIQGLGGQEIEEFLRDRGRYRYQIAVVTAGLSSETISPELIQRLSLDIQRDVDFKVKVVHKEWFLCDITEELIGDDAKSRALLVVNDGIMLMKFSGKMAGICLRSTTTKGGTLIEGNWYCPLDDRTRGIMCASFDNGNAFFQLPFATWVLMRPVRGNLFSFTQAKEIALNLTPQLPMQIQGLSRHDYRMAKRGR